MIQAAKEKKTIPMVWLLPLLLAVLTITAITPSSKAATLSQARVRDFLPENKKNHRDKSNLTPQNHKRNSNPKQKHAPGRTSFHKDHLGSTVAVTDENGMIPFGDPVMTQYRPFGLPRGDAVGLSKKLDYGFTDQEFDHSTGLYNYDARLYNPEIGVFITADSMLQDVYDPQLLNRYAYTRNNPIKNVDPDGHIVFTLTALGAYAIAGAIIAIAGMQQQAKNIKQSDVRAFGKNVARGVGKIANVYATGVGQSGIPYGGPGAMETGAEAAYNNLRGRPVAQQKVTNQLGGPTGSQDPKHRGGKSAESTGETSKSGERTAEEAGISPGDAKRIQNASNRTKQKITVVGSRATGEAESTSDWDYVMSGNAKQRHSAKSSVPRGTSGGEQNSMGQETGIDVFKEEDFPVSESTPQVVFQPE